MGKPPAIQHRRQAKGDAVLIPASPAAEPPAVKQSATKATSASAQEITTMIVNAGSLKHHAGASKDHQ